MVGRCWGECLLGRRVFRDESDRCYVITLVVVSTIAGAARVVLYVILSVVQSVDIQTGTADAFFALPGGAAAFIRYRAG